MTAHKDERLRILRMIEEGKLSAEEAARLLDALNGDGAAPAAKDRSRRLRVVVTQRDAPQVNVTVPMELARIALRLIPRGLGTAHADVEELVRVLEEADRGKWVDIRSETEGVHVEVFVE